MSNITKLSPTNYITWHLQIRELLEAHELHFFLDETDQTPFATIVNETGVTQPNPTFAAWNRQDKMLYSAIIVSLSLDVKPIVS